MYDDSGSVDDCEISSIIDFTRLPAREWNACPVVRWMNKNRDVFQKQTPTIWPARVQPWNRNDLKTAARARCVFSKFQGWKFELDRSERDVSPKGEPIKTSPNELNVRHIVTYVICLRLVSTAIAYSRHRTAESRANGGLHRSSAVV